MGGYFLLGVGLAVGLGCVAFVLFIVLKQSLMQYSQDAIKNAQEQLLMLSDERLKADQNKITGEVDTRKQEIQGTVDKLQEQLARYEKMMKDFEHDRIQKYGSIERQLESASRETERLQKTTNHLTSILGNVKQRGQWGERMAEDILQHCGLQEGLHYEKQKTLESNDLRPDYTFYLPQNHKVVMDVKFPLNRYNDYMNSENDAERKQLKKGFLDDVKMRIKDVAGKDYRPVGEGSLDYVLLFIPNEQVYGFVNNEYPGLIDETLQQKIILCSPWTLYAVLRIIAQAWQNYNYSEGLKEIIQTIHEFGDEFEKFKDAMDKVGDRISKAQIEYDKMVGTRQKQLDRKIDKITQHGIGKGYLVEGDVSSGEDE